MHTEPREPIRCLQQSSTGSWICGITRFPRSGFAFALLLNPYVLGFHLPLLDAKEEDMLMGPLWELVEE